MTTISDRQLREFCSKYDINHTVGKARRFAYTPVPNIVHKATDPYDSIDLKYEIRTQYELTVDEDALAEIVRKDVQITTEEHLRRHNVTVREAWEQYQMAVNLCRSYYAQD